MRKGSFQTAAIWFLLLMLFSIGSLFFFNKKQKTETQIKKEFIQKINETFIENKKMTEFIKKEKISIPEGYELISFPISKNRFNSYSYEIFNNGKFTKIGKGDSGFVIKNNDGNITIKIYKKTINEKTFDVVSSEVKKTVEILNKKVANNPNKKEIKSSWI